MQYDEERDFFKIRDAIKDTKAVDFIGVFDTPNLTNIGLIVDANFKGVEKRLKFILKTLSEKLDADFSNISISLNGVNMAYDDIKIGICAACHPFFTGEQKFVDTAGRIEKFSRRYGTAESRKKSA